MELILQFPFADFRPFLPTDSGRLEQPHWPFPQPGREFVRQSGAVRRRRRGGLSPWSGEEFYSHAARAVRLRQDVLRQTIDDTPVFDNKGVSRRFHAFGPVARFELAIGATPARGTSAISLLHLLLGLKVAVPDAKGALKVQCLADARIQLARLYLRATTKRRKGAPRRVRNWWLEPGDPLCVISFDYGELSTDSLSIGPNPPRACGGSKVTFAWIEHRKVLFGLWLASSDDWKTDEARALRLHLLRLHAERECLKRVLAGLGTQLRIKPGTDASDRLEEYLDGALGLLDKQKRFGFEQSPLLDAVRDSFALAVPEDQWSLATGLETARKSVARKMERFVLSRVNQASVVNIVHGTQTIGRIDMRSINFGGNVSVVGDFNVVVADQIENSFNRVAGSNVKAELKAALQELAVEVAKVAKDLPAEKAEEAARDLDALTKEATAKSPRRKWYEVSAGGLLEAAKAVGETAKPLIDVVQKVLLLLA